MLKPASAMENLNSQLMELCSAVRNSDLRQVKRLLAADVSPIQCATNGQTALMVAARCGDPQIMQLICLAATNRPIPAQIFFPHRSIEPTESGVQLLVELGNKDLGVEKLGIKTDIELGNRPTVDLSTFNSTQADTSPSISPYFDAALSSASDPLSAVSIQPSDKRTINVSVNKPASQSVKRDRLSASKPTAAKALTSKQSDSASTNNKLPATQPTAIEPPATQPTAIKPPAPKLNVQSLELAVRRNDVNAVNALIKAGVSFRPARWYDTPVLVVAAAKGYGEIVQSLIDAGANVHVGCDQLPLHAAAANGQLNVVQRLLNSGAYIHAVTEGGRTALMEAAAGGHFLVAELLISRGANVNAVCRGETALMMAAEGGHHSVYELLYSRVAPSGRVPFAQSLTDASQLSLSPQLAE